MMKKIFCAYLLMMVALSTGCWMFVQNQIPLPIPAGPFLWLDADAAYVTKDGSNNVSSWNDRSGHGYNFTQATAGVQPLWVASSINSLPALVGDGVGKFLQNTAVTWFPNQFTFTIVVRNDNGSANGSTFCDTQIGAPNFPLSSASNLGSIFSGTTYYVQTSSSNPMHSPTDAAAHVITVSTDHTITTGLNAWYDGVQGLTNLDSSNAGQTGTGILFAGYAAYLKGAIAEVVAYNRILNSTDRGTVEGYLKTKYATP
jgi:hypothetical protein